MQLQLICHGMMLFWYVPPTAYSSDGYRILIPQTRPDDEFNHVFLLGLNAGAVSPVLTYAGDAERTKTYALQFSNVPSTKERGEKAQDCNLTFYKRGATQALPNTGFDKSAGIAFDIFIPYPASEERVRVADYSANAFAPSGTVSAFNISVRRLVGATVFSFQIDDPNSPVVLQGLGDDAGDNRTIQRAPITTSLKLHLYSQPPVPGGTDHLAMMFNPMLSLNGANIDLERNMNASCRPDPPNLPVPAGLGHRDLLHLSELVSLNIPVADVAKYAAEKQTRRMRESGKVHMTSVDPAECGQGSGC